MKSGATTSARPNPSNKRPKKIADKLTVSHRLLSSVIGLESQAVIDCKDVDGAQAIENKFPLLQLFIDFGTDDLTPIECKAHTREDEDIDLKFTVTEDIIKKCSPDYDFRDSEHILSRAGRACHVRFDGHDITGSPCRIAIETRAMSF